jgi:hypothetical protein
LFVLQEETIVVLSDKAEIRDSFIMLCAYIIKQVVPMKVIRSRKKYKKDLNLYKVLKGYSF